MDRRDEAFAYFPVAIVGAVIGLGIMVGCGYFAYHYGKVGDNTRRAFSYAVIDGRVEWAGWRISAARTGPDRFLQIRFEDDHRGFLVAEDELPRAHRRRFEDSQTRDNVIPDLVGVTAAVAVDSTLLGNETPYISGLQVGEETILPVGGKMSDSQQGWRHTGVLSLGWMGALVGLVLLAASVQHVVVCVRYGGSRTGA